jgi:hypothetical protein
MQFFDLHLCLRPLLNPALLARDFAFLAERDGYAQRFLNLPALELPNLVVRSLRRELRRSRFWARYGSILVPGLAAASKPIWDLQVPLHLQPRGFALKYGPDPRAQLAASAFLFPAGWSTQLVLSPRGPQTLSALSSMVADILHGTPFQLGAAPRRLSQVFAECAARWCEQLYGSDVKTTLLRARYMVIELLSHGEVPAFASSGSGASSIMSDADRARIHSTILGSTVEVPDLISREQAPNFLCTRFSHGDFALTYFDQGSLLSLSNTVRKGKSARAAECLAGNVVACTMMAYFLAGFLNEAQDFAASEPRVAALCHAAGAAVRHLPSSYNSRFCQDLFTHHGTLAKLGKDPLQSATSTKGGEEGA